jgi:c-di-GMP-binding flagellar brake protein YcgR
MEGNQRRRHVRVSTTRLVDVRRVDQARGWPTGDITTAQVRNLSAGGALLILEDPVWRGTTLELRIAWTRPDLHTSLRARVIRVAPNPDGVAVSVQFHDTSQAARLDLVRWVLQEAKRTDQLADRIPV